MSTHRIRHLVQKPGRDGPRFFWQPTTALRAQGWKQRRLAGPTLRDAMEQAEDINRELDTWREAGGARPARSRFAAGSVRALIADYKAGKRWQRLAPRTQRDYGHYLDAIADWAGDQPARAITPRAVQSWHDAMASRTEGKGRQRRTIETPSRAAAAVRVLSLLLEEGRRLGYVTTNAASRPGLSVERQREPVLWSRAALDHLVRTADAMGWHSVGTATLLNFWCGQRQGDVLALAPWRLEDGAIVLRQSKRGRKVVLPVQLVPELVQRLEAERQRTSTIASLTHMLLHEGTGRPWQGYTFTHTFAEIRATAAAGLPAKNIPPMPEVASLRWMELRHTAVTALHLAGLDALRISAITGHTPQSVQGILDRHYLIRTAEGAEQGFRARLQREGGE